MPSFESQEQLDTFALSWIVTSNDRALLVHPNGGISELPADQVQHYLDIGFRWQEAPPKSGPPPEPAAPKMKLAFSCSCGKAYRYESSLKGHRTKTSHA